MTILVVEDEKLIRQGIVMMIKRAQVQVDEVLECKNGLEAVEILNSRSVEVVFTDIRMPKMDGVALIKEIRSRQNRPHVVVISGYEDFNYALEAIRGGVEDYILKPVEREKINELLLKFSEILAAEQLETRKAAGVSAQQLKYFLLRDDISEEQRQEVHEQFLADPLFESFAVICSPGGLETDLTPGRLMKIPDVGDHTIFIVQEAGKDELNAAAAADSCVGISSLHRGIDGLADAYREAVQARLTAFVTGSSTAYPLIRSGSAEMSIADGFGGQFVQRIGTGEFEKSLTELENYSFYARRGQLGGDQFVALLEELPAEMLRTFGRVIETDLAGYERIRRPLKFVCVKEYLNELRIWIGRIRELIFTDFDDFQKKEYMNEALRYIQANYHRNLNMAMVSNHVSMNYSLFSITFKQYTGINFVNYLKDIRIKEAKRLLSSTDEKIIDISRMVGYDNEKHFMKTFKHVCGVSPSSYRKNMQLEKKS